MSRLHAPLPGCHKGQKALPSIHTCKHLVWSPLVRGPKRCHQKTRAVLCSVWLCGSNMRITDRRACCSVCVTRQSDGVHIHSWRMKGSQGQISCAHVCTEYEACGRKHVYGSPEKETVEKQKNKNKKEKNPPRAYTTSHMKDFNVLM